jgi:hypothetical protein
MYAEFEPRVYTATAGRRVLSLSDGTNSNRLQLLVSANGGITQFANSSNVTQVNDTYSSGLTGTQKALIRYATDAFFLHVGGVQRNSDLSATLPLSLSRIGIGQNVDETLQLNGWLRAVAIGNTGITEAQANEITTP